MTMIRFGIDRLVDDNFAMLWGKRVGLYTNLSAVDRDLMTTHDIFRQAESVNLAALFSPEHGLAGTVADGVAVDSAVDVRTGLTVHSLYGATYRPKPDMLDGLDLIVCDIQDIGVRYYTFLWTLTHILEVCGEVGLPILILDRPNPLGGRVDGGTLDSSLASLVGRYPIPVQHGLTLGEVACVINGTWNPTPAEIDVIPVDGWTRDQTWEMIGRAFVPPSLNMAHVVTAQHYSGSCLIEGTTLSEGRGTPLPFEIVGAPFIDAWELADAVNELSLAGAIARPYQFCPTDSKHKGSVCQGIHLHIIDADGFHPLKAWLMILRTIRHLYADDFGWLPPYEPGGLQHFDRLIGDTQTRKLINANAPLEAITTGWDAAQATFADLSRPYRLYEG